jgi:hypothetical protein
MVTFCINVRDVMLTEGSALLLFPFYTYYDGWSLFPHDDEPRSPHFL